MEYGTGLLMKKNQPKVTREINPRMMKWIFEDGEVVKLMKDQHLFLTRGTGQWFFSFPAGMLRVIQRKLLRNNYSISMNELKKCVFVMDIRGMRLPNNDWIRFDEE